METTTKIFSFDKEGHVYTLDGKSLTGVTTILGVINKPALIPWAAGEVVKHIKEHGRYIDLDEYNGLLVTDELLDEAKVAHRKKKEKAGDHGTEVHRLVEEYINTCIEKGGIALDLPANTDDLQISVSVFNFIRWARDNKVKFISSEQRMYSEKYWFAGTADIVCEIEGKRYVGDIKTSSNIYPENFIQASAYSQALIEMGIYDKFDGVVILNCKKDGKFQFKYNYDIEGNWECFKACLTIYRQLNAINPNK